MCYYCVVSAFYCWNFLCLCCVDYRLMIVNCGGDLSVFLMVMVSFILSTSWIFVCIPLVGYVYLLLCLLFIFLFCFSLFMYFDIMGNIFNDTIFALSLNNFWEKDVQLSVPMSNIMGLMISGVPCTRSKWWKFLSALTYFTLSGSSIVINCKVGVFLMLFHFMFVSAGMTIVCKNELLFSNVKY